MSAVAEVLSTAATHPDPRGSDLPTCPVCADSMVAAEASAYLHDNFISYLWTCDTCGYGFVTKHSLGVSPATCHFRVAPSRMRTAESYGTSKSRFAFRSP